MSNKKMVISTDGKSILDKLTEQLDLERPFVVQLALAKGIQISKRIPNFTYDKGPNKWTIPDNIIKEENFILFKHLIQNEAQQSINNDQIHRYMIFFIESGLRELTKINLEKTSMEDLKISIL